MYLLLSNDDGSTQSADSRQKPAAARNVIGKQKDVSLNLKNGLHALEEAVDMITFRTTKTFQKYLERNFEYRQQKAGDVKLE